MCNAYPVIVVIIAAFFTLVSSYFPYLGKFIALVGFSAASMMITGGFENKDRSTLNTILFLLPLYISGLIFSLGFNQILTSVTPNFFLQGAIIAFVIFFLMALVTITLYSLPLPKFLFRR
jgi:hypothetical protein